MLLVHEWRGRAERLPTDVDYLLQPLRPDAGGRGDVTDSLFYDVQADSAYKEHSTTRRLASVLTQEMRESLERGGEGRGGHQAMLA